MRSALYYPHTELRQANPPVVASGGGAGGSGGDSAGSEQLLKRSLLLWDDLEFIVPYPE
jgi:hypothetical protein